MWPRPSLRFPVVPLLILLQCCLTSRDSAPGPRCDPECEVQEVGLANGKTVAMVSRELGISEQTYYRWRKE